ncbi:MAG TPA: hypothetical protein VLS90_17570 [Thermodesulfobacteriota bacterium]|nr:hypothetical protein [Thermodesulfobacteriota bacterium]
MRWKPLFAAARRLESTVGDRLMNVDTDGYIAYRADRGVHRDAHAFNTISHSAIKKAIRLAHPEPADVAVVLGCGKGRSLCHLARFPFRKVVGIEIE